MWTRKFELNSQYWHCFCLWFIPNSAFSCQKGSTLCPENIVEDTWVNIRHSYSAIKKTTPPNKWNMGTSNYAYGKMKIHLTKAVRNKKYLLKIFLLCQYKGINMYTVQKKAVWDYCLSYHKKFHRQESNMSTDHRILCCVFLETLQLTS